LLAGKILQLALKRVRAFAGTKEAHAISERRIQTPKAVEMNLEAWIVCEGFAALTVAQRNTAD
jgi:hypothetical protein